MKCWVALTEHKNSWMIKLDHTGSRKIVLNENVIVSKFSSNLFRFNKISILDWFTPCLSNISFLWRLPNSRTSNFRWFNKTKTLWKIIIIKNNHRHQIKMSLNSNKEDSDHLSKWHKQNVEEYEGTGEEVEDSGKRKDKETKKSI